MSPRLLIFIDTRSLLLAIRMQRLINKTKAKARRTVA